MLSKWTIRNKLYFVLALLLAVVGMLAWSAIHGLYAYRSMVRSLYRRVPELSLANEFGRATDDLRVLWYSERPGSASADFSTPGAAADPLTQQLTTKLGAAREAFRKYQNRLQDGLTYDYGLPITDSRQEQETTRAILATMNEIERLNTPPRWQADAFQSERMTGELDRLQKLAWRLPTFLHDNIEEAVEEARTQYRTLILLDWITTLITVLFTGWLLYLFYRWVFRPLRKLIAGSRRMARGEFAYRIRLETHDEMSELADNMNGMTRSFLEIHTELDKQVAERTRQVVRGEQLASVGFLAAGVAHEINNPLSSITVCAESLQTRVAPLLDAANPEHKIIGTYLDVIEKEAFRCKEITEKLLDLSRTGDGRRTATDLRSLVQDVVDIVRHVAKYQDKRIDLAAGGPLHAVVSGREIKQVVLNLITNALDSIDDDGRLTIEFATRPGEVEIIFTDDGCGMTDEVHEHLFEPFFTRRRNGGGTGLGLSISYRIVADHQGSITAHSDGPGKGSQFRLRLPVAAAQQETPHHYQAA